MEIELVQFAERGELAVIARTAALASLPGVKAGMTEEQRAMLERCDPAPVDYEPMVSPGWPYTSCWIFNMIDEKRQRGMERALRVLDGEEEA